LSINIPLKILKARDKYLTRILEKRPDFKERFQYVCEDICIFGPKGAGKTLTHAYIGIDYMLRGKNVFANFPFNLTHKRLKWWDDRIKDYVYIDTTQLRKYFYYYSSASELKEMFDEGIIQRGALLIDDIAEICGGRRTTTKQNLLVTHLTSQFRKNYVDLYYTAQRWTDADPKIRQNLTFVWVPVYWRSVIKGGREYKIAWVQIRVFIPEDVDKFDEYDSLEVKLETPMEFDASCVWFVYPTEYKVKSFYEEHSARSRSRRRRLRIRV